MNPLQMSEEEKKKIRQKHEELEKQELEKKKKLQQGLKKPENK